MFARSYHRRMYAFQIQERKLRAPLTRQKFVFGPLTVVAGLLFAAIFISFFHLLHFNQVATKGYDLRRLEMDRQYLLEQFQIKNMHVTDIKSLATIGQSSRAQRMVKAGNVFFMRGDTALAFGRSP